MTDNVNHPAHYTSHPSGIECIDVTRHMNFNIGSAIKYLWRNGKKDPKKTVEDLRKAVWYILDEIKLIEQNEDQHAQKEFEFGCGEKACNAEEDRKHEAILRRECDFCGYDVGDPDQPRDGHGVGCPNIPPASSTD